MKAKDLMQGDWVKYKTENYEPYSIEIAFAQITGFNKYGIVYAEVPNGGYCPTLFCEDAIGYANRKYDKIMPIPLTKEILEKNGFKYDGGEIWFIEWEDKDGKHCLNFRKMYDIVTNVWNALGIMISGEVALITSVHELQHALRLCGLNELADNFKVE